MDKNLTDGTNLLINNQSSCNDSHEFLQNLFSSFDLGTFEHEISKVFIVSVWLLKFEYGDREVCRWMTCEEMAAPLFHFNIVLITYQNEINDPQEILG